MTCKPVMDGIGDCEVLCDVAKGFVDRDFVDTGSPWDRAGENLADLASYVTLIDQASLEGVTKFASLAQDMRAIVGDEPAALDRLVIDFAKFRAARTDEIEMLAGPQPSAF